MIRLVVATSCLWALVVAPAAASAADGPAHDEPDDGIDNPADELPDGAETIIGSPDPGPEPEGPGDRGGWAQLLTLGVLAAAVGFILWRVIRAAPASVSPQRRRRSP